MNSSPGKLTRTVGPAPVVSGARIRAARELLKLSPAELAADCGTSVSSINAIEGGQRFNYEIAQRVIEYLVGRGIEFTVQAGIIGTRIDS